MKKTLMFAMSLLIVCGAVVSCSKDDKNKVTGNTNPPVVQPSDPTLEEVLNSTDTLSSSRYEIYQMYVGAGNLITSDIIQLTITPEVAYQVSFCIKDKTDGRYAWVLAAGDNWDISGSTLVLKGLNQYTIWANPFYNDNPQNCQISFKGISRTLTFKSNAQRPLTWEEQWLIDLNNSDLSRYSIEAKFATGLTSYDFTVPYGSHPNPSVPPAGGIVVNIPTIQLYFDGRLKDIPYTINNANNVVSFQYMDWQLYNNTKYQGFNVSGGVIKYSYDYDYYKYGSRAYSVTKPAPYNTSINLTLTVKNRTVTGLTLNWQS